HPPPTQPHTTAPSTLKTALAPARAEVEPLASTTTLRAKGSLAAISSAVTPRTSVPAKSAVRLVIATAIRPGGVLADCRNDRRRRAQARATRQSLLSGLRQANEFNSFISAEKMLDWF